MKKSNMKKHLLWTGIGAALALLTLFAAAEVSERRTADEMTRAASAFVASLAEAERAKALFPFDADVREDWHFIPKAERKGLSFQAMQPEQVHLAHVLLHASMSAKGYTKAASIMSLESLVRERERRAGGGPMLALRDPFKYYICVFGEPSPTGTWGWSIEGHHISQNFTVVGGKAVASAPAFFGSEPHLVDEGTRKGFRVLAAEEDIARELLNSLSDEQKKQAIVGDQAPRDIFTSNQRKVEFTGQPKGLAYSAMNDAQKKIVERLVEEYITNVPEDVAERRRTAWNKADKNDLHFAWMGSLKQGIGEPHYYRLHGTTFLIEYDNIQHNANHSHTVWRDFAGDFGRDLLAEHHQKDHQ
jgi:hypothetical protein